MMGLKIHEDAFNLLAGKLIAEGIHRKVFECRLRPDLVVKVEFEEDWRYFANVHEDKFYSDAPPAVKEWLAPCRYLSPDGRILLQDKVQPITDKTKLPEKIPAFLGDVKPENFGWLNGKLVCVDYVYVNTPKPSVKLVKATWGTDE